MCLFPPSPSKALSLIRDESHLAEISSAMAHRVESYLWKFIPPFEIGISRSWITRAVSFFRVSWFSRRKWNNVSYVKKTRRVQFYDKREDIWDMRYMRSSLMKLVIFSLPLGLAEVEQIVSRFSIFLPLLFLVPSPFSPKRSPLQSRLITKLFKRTI